MAKIHFKVYVYGAEAWSMEVIMRMEDMTSRAHVFHAHVFQKAHWDTGTVRW